MILPPAQAQSIAHDSLGVAVHGLRKTVASWAVWKLLPKLNPQNIFLQTHDLISLGVGGQGVTLRGKLLMPLYRRESGSQG